MGVAAGVVLVLVRVLVLVLKQAVARSVQQRRVAVLNPPRPNGARDTRLIEAQHSGVPFWVRLMLLVNSVVMSLLVHLNPALLYPHARMHGLHRVLNATASQLKVSNRKWTITGKVIGWHYETRW